MSRHASAAWAHLEGLQMGDVVPDDLYVLDYRDGEPPRWIVQEVEELETGGRVLVLVDRDNDTDLFGARQPVALRVITHPNKTMRSRPYLLGGHPGYTLCDMDQQARHVAQARGTALPT